MRQPRRIDKTSKNPPVKPKVVKKRPIKFKKKNHPKYGTSKLERDFAREFLDANNINYIYQYEVKDMGGRFFDFAIISYKKNFLKEEKDGLLSVKQNDLQYTPSLFIEVDGDFYHYNPETQGNKEPSRMQQKNMKVDEIKNRWALLHGYPIMRIWESDIRKKPKEVMKRLKERLYLMDEEIRKKGRNLGKKL